MTSTAATTDTAPNPNIVPTLQSEAALTVFGESVTANPDGVVGMLRGTEKGQQLIAAILTDACKHNPDALDTFFNHTSAGSRQLLKMAAGIKRGVTALDSDDLLDAPLMDHDVVRVVECSDGVEELTLGVIPVSSMPQIVQELIKCVLKAEGKKMCYKGQTDEDGGSMSRLSDGDCVDRFYDGSIATTPESMFDRSFDDYLTDKYGQTKTDAEEISQMSGVAYEADEDDEEGEEGDEEDVDISDFIASVVETAEEELRSILENMHKEVYDERASSTWFKGCTKLKNPPSYEVAAEDATADTTADATADTTADAGTKKRTLPFDRKGKRPKRLKEFDMGELPVFERRPVLTILYDANSW